MTEPLTINAASSAILYAALAKAIVVVETLMLRKSAEDYMGALAIEVSAYKAEQDRLSKAFPELTARVLMATEDLEFRAWIVSGVKEGQRAVQKIVVIGTFRDAEAKAQASRLLFTKIDGPHEYSIVLKSYEGFDSDVPADISALRGKRKSELGA